MLLLKYFVLKPSAKTKNDPHAIASQKAMKAYARAIKETDYYLYRDLMDWVKMEETIQKGMK